MLPLGCGSEGRISLEEDIELKDRALLCERRNKRLNMINVKPSENSANMKDATQLPIHLPCHWVVFSHNTTQKSAATLAGSCSETLEKIFVFLSEHRRCHNLLVWKKIKAADPTVSTQFFFYDFPNKPQT